MLCVVVQAYGAGNYKLVGLILQRAVLVCFLVCIPVAMLWMRSESLLLALGQDPAIAVYAGRYLMLCIPCLFLTIAMECVRKFLQSQRVVAPMMMVAAFTTCIAPLYFWTFIFRLNLGLDGAAYAFICCQLTTLTGLLLFQIWRASRLGSDIKQTWGGFSWDAFKGWGEYLRYGLPAAAMICLEWWAYEVVILLAGKDQPHQLLTV